VLLNIYKPIIKKFSKSITFGTNPFLSGFFSKEDFPLSNSLQIVGNLS